MKRSGFTILHLLVVIAVLLVLVCLGLIGAARLRHESRERGETARVRALQGSLAAASRNNGDRWPLPSLLDNDNTTVPERGLAKDTTANLMSILVSSGYIPCELLVSENETNPSVHAYQEYEYSSPSGAVDRLKALWDPKLCATLDGSKKGNISFAHLQPTKARLQRVAGSSANVPVVGTRGPEIAGCTKNEDRSVTPRLANPRSNALRLLGDGSRWSGAIAFDDHHVEMVRRVLREGMAIRDLPSKYACADGKQWPDLWCYDEPDDPKATNDYLGIFIKAGETPAEFKAAWD